MTHTNKLKIVIISTILFTIALWISQLYLYDGWYLTDTITQKIIILKYLGKTAAFATTLLICWNFVINCKTNWHKSFMSHEERIALSKWTTNASLVLMFLDPIFLSLMRINDPVNIPKFFLFREWGLYYSIGHNLGLIIILLIMCLTIILRLKWINNVSKIVFRSFFGLIPFLLILHIFFVASDISKYPVLGVWFYGWLVLAIVCYCKDIFDGY
jgi:hypothetical protein